MTVLPGTGARIVAIDDNFLHLKLVQLLLVPEGHAVTTALNAEDGLVTVRELLPDLLLVDVDLPGMDGLTLTRIVRDDPRTRHLPIVVVSSRQDLRDRARALAAGATQVIGKPIDTRTFADTIGAVLRATRTVVPHVHRPAPLHWERETAAS